ncbi:ABC transporter substrate-binding protein [Sphingobium algorifonticola]|uniref:ABC transporter substrate-binding protein n=1 Tax=Sphingobium algorifonticola TaxID=2008318 RepID=A0A437J6I3_9SPHN|nr:ABC transporter substrate-binding protein [Sphingobium algorifonticola]RVT40684.1 ABC transporter substrate-binding protein [Sphingobium algorifonticola]
MTRPSLHCALAATLMLLGGLAGCSERQDGPVVVSVIGTTKQLADPLHDPLSAAGKLMLESTAQGLVAFDARGDVMPALAQRWIVQDDGRSYIFRLRRARWANGAKIEAADVTALLRNRIATNLLLDSHGDLAAIQDVSSMTGEVLELQLSVPRPYLLQMLAQPQMAITRRDGGTGPYRKERRGAAWFLRPVVDDAEAEAAIPAWENRVLRAERGAMAIARFKLGLASLVLGGRYQDLPLVNRADIPNRAVRVDPVQGLFGLAVVGRSDFLNDRAVRAALNSAIDRERLPNAFSLGGWTVTDRIVPQILDLPREPTAPEWSALSVDDRRVSAQATIAQWRAANGAIPPLRIAMPLGSGSRLLFTLIAQDFARIGVPSRQVPPNADADLRLIDEVAAYDSALWYLGRVSCARKVHCDAAAQEKLIEAELATAVDAVQGRIAEAEALTVAHNGYFPLGAPIRWSLVDRALNGFAPSTRARHPLNQLFRTTN